jgi:hypothetical protein
MWTKFRKSWSDEEFLIKYLRRKKRFIDNKSMIEKVVRCLASVPSSSSVPSFNIEEVELLLSFPESFL